MENKKQELSSVWRVGFLITYLHTLMWTEVFNVRPSVLKLFPPAVQSSAFVLKTSPGDNFAPDRAFSNLSICGVGRAEARYCFHLLTTQRQRVHLNPLSSGHNRSQDPSSGKHKGMYFGSTLRFT